MPRPKAEVCKSTTKEKCVLCGQYEPDVLKLGERYRIGKVIVHYYCVLLSTEIAQNGTGLEGVQGFLLSDIKVMRHRSKRVICSYCKRGGASIYCSRRGCPLVFHLPCGIKQNAMSQFRDRFLSFCAQHRPRQAIPPDSIQHAVDTPPDCIVCFNPVDYQDHFNSLWAPCCGRSWYHRRCLSELALAMGSLFKCAICSNTRLFRKQMTQFGIFVPIRDAAWELETNAFSELLFKYNKCDATKCLCLKGLQYNRQHSGWELVLCHLCGSRGTHVRCAGMSIGQKKWTCADCGPTPSGNQEKVPIVRTIIPAVKRKRVVGRSSSWARGSVKTIRRSSKSNKKKASSDWIFYGYVELKEVRVVLERLPLDTLAKYVPLANSSHALPLATFSQCPSTTSSALLPLTDSTQCLPLAKSSSLHPSTKSSRRRSSSKASQRRSLAESSPLLPQAASSSLFPVTNSSELPLLPLVNFCHTFGKSSQRLLSAKSVKCPCSINATRRLPSTKSTRRLTLAKSSQGPSKVKSSPRGSLAKSSLLPLTVSTQLPLPDSSQCPPSTIFSPVLPLANSNQSLPLAKSSKRRPVAKSAVLPLHNTSHCLPLSSSSQLPLTDSAQLLLPDSSQSAPSTISSPLLPLTNSTQGLPLAKSSPLRPLAKSSKRRSGAKSAELPLHNTSQCLPPATSSSLAPLTISTQLPLSDSSQSAPSSISSPVLPLAKSSQGPSKAKQSPRRSLAKSAELSPQCLPSTNSFSLFPLTGSAQLPLPDSSLYSSLALPFTNSNQSLLLAKPAPLHPSTKSSHRRSSSKSSQLRPVAISSTRRSLAMFSPRLSLSSPPLPPTASSTTTTTTASSSLLPPPHSIELVTVPSSTTQSVSSPLLPSSQTAQVLPLSNSPRFFPLTTPSLADTPQYTPLGNFTKILPLPTNSYLNPWPQFEGFLPLSPTAMLFSTISAQNLEQALDREYLEIGSVESALLH